MRKLIYAALLTVTSLFVGCGNSEIESWNSSMVWFTDTLINFSNMAQPDVPMGGTLKIPVPLTVASEVSGSDRTVVIELVRKPADNRTLVEVPTTATVRAGKLADTLYVDLTNSTHLDEVYDTIAVRILPSSDFQPGLKAYQTATICLHNGYMKPEWWDSDADRYLGYFTQLKMKVIVAVMEGIIDPRSDKDKWSSSDLELQYNIYRFNDYVEQNDIRYPDKDPNAPGTRPKFGWRTW